MTHVPGCVGALLLALITAAASAQTPAGGSAPPRPAVPSGPGVQRPGLPPRDGLPLTGTARLRGRVASTDGVALRRAQVQLFASDRPLRRVTTTDAEGRYDFLDLPSGRYSLTASKAGYVSVPYGQRRPLEPGTTLNVSEGETLNQLDFALPRGSVIAGRVTDEFGEPMAGAQVQAQRYQYGPDGQRRLTMVGPGMVQTDDLGQFRVFGLTPGEYVVSAVVRGPFLIAPSGVSVSDVNEGYPPTFYPGTVNPAEAQAISVAVGQEASVQFSLLPARMSRVTGSVLNSQGRPATGAMLSLRNGNATGFTTFGGAQVGSDGAFTLASVPPGEYQIDVRPQGRPDADGEFASVPLTVSGPDVTVRIVTSKGTKVSGRVVFEGTSSRRSDNPLRVFPSSPDPGQMFFPALDPQANGAIADDGTFEISGLMGKVLLRVGTPAGWTLKSVSLEGRDVTDEPLDASGSEPITGVRIVLTDKLTEVGGMVNDNRGQLVKDYTLIIVPAEAVSGNAATRFTRAGRPDNDGRFRVRGMPPGRYVAIAVESFEQGRQWVPEVQEKIRQTGRRFTLREGQSSVVDLKVADAF